MEKQSYNGDNGGLRYDAGKPRVGLLPPDALLALAEVYTQACAPSEAYPQGKYPERNWERGMNYSKVTDSLLRHLLKWMGGEDVDAESKLLHTAHIAWNAMALLTYQLREIGVDDRGKEIKPPLPSIGQFFRRSIPRVEEPDQESFDARLRESLKVPDGWKIDHKLLPYAAGNYVLLAHGVVNVITEIVEDGLFRMRPAGDLTAAPQLIRGRAILARVKYA